jgi:streptomycin 6-kinase
VQLPALIAEISSHWELEIEPPFDPLYYSYVAPAVCSDGRRVVLKATVPHSGLDNEIEALRCFDGRGAVVLLNADPVRGCVLLERLEPGSSLVELDDERAISIAAELIREIRRPAPEGSQLPSVEAWTSALGRSSDPSGGGAGPLPGLLVARAERMLAELLASSPDPAVLHADLHHRNILAAERRPWLAIDPKGVIGDPAYEAGALLRNPLPEFLAASRPDRMISRRLDQLAEELGLDRSRLLDWGFVQAVLAARWSLEDHGNSWKPMIQCAELILGAGA